MKRVIYLFLAAILVMGTMIGCNSTTEPELDSVEDQGQEAISNEDNATEGKYDEELTVKVVLRGDVRVIEEDLFAPLIKEKFNMVLETTDINNNDFVTKMNLGFASGEAPDVNTAQRPEFMLNEWTEAGYLRGFTMEELKEKMPNYVAQYTEEEWEVVWPAIKHSDGKAYYFPARRADVMNMAWMYRKDTFDDLGIEFPDTTDGLIDALKTIKNETGRYPFVSASADNVLWAFTGFFQAFGLPELSPRDLSYVDPITGEFVPYIFTTDNYREHIKFMNELYEEGLIWPEFATGTKDQVNAMKAQGHGYVTWGYPDKIDTEYNRLSQNADPDAQWDWAKVMLTSNPEEGYYYKAGPYHNADGIAFSTDADDEVVERFMELVDWLYTEEGMALRTYGFEGVTYTKEGDNYVFMDQMKSPAESEGKTLTNYGVVSMGMQHPNLNEYYKPYLTELKDTFYERENYYFHIAPIFNFTSEENSELANISTSLSQTAQEYYAKFIMGHIDIENDQEWENYINIMNKLGLERFIEIRTSAYEKAN